MLAGVAAAGVLGALWLGGWVTDRWWWTGLGLLAAAALGMDLVALRRRGIAAAEGTSGGRAGEAADPSLEGIAERFEGLAAMLGAGGLGLVVTDAPGAVRGASAAARELLEHGGPGPWAATHPAGAFFGVPVEDPQSLEALHRFFAGAGDSGEGLVTVAASRRQLWWAGQVLSGREGLGRGRAFLVREVTAERRFDTLKSDFLATISHELRTPLTSLRGSLQLVVARAPGLGTADLQLLEIGIKNAERLIQVINDLLDIDSLEQDRMAFRFTTLAPGDLIATALERMAPALADREVHVERDVSDALPVIHGDRDRLVQVVANLLANAAKYTPLGGTMWVRARPREGGIQIDVQDAGPGIPLAEQPHVFERFWRADRTGAEAGAGLGLAICRAVIGRHGGRIWVESEPGAGAVFSVYLPRSLFRLETEASESGAETSGSRILLIEGDADARAVLQASLEGYGYEVIAVSTGAEGVAVVRRERPAAVVLDLLLPDIGGHDVLRIVKSSAETMSVPVLVLSVDAEREAARRLGAWDVLRKPVDFEAVRWSLARALRRVGRPEGHLVMGVAPAVSRDLAVLATALEQAGHRIHRAGDVGELVQWTASNYPDVLVVDDDFLPYSRDEAAERLRHPVTQQCIPLLFLTSEPRGDGAERRWLELRKPLSREDFLDGAWRALTGRDRS
jgi:signal transduction histidine kinase/DNA-binding response OmpR family regulator